MTQKFRSYFGILTFLIAIFTLNISCVKDDLELNSEENIINTPSPVTNLDFISFSKQNYAKETLKKLNSLKFNKINNKGSLENSLEIDSTQIKLLTINGITSYTFRVITSNLDNGNFDNLVIQTDSLQNTSAYYIKYFPLDSNYNNFSDHFYGTKKIYVLDEAQTNLNSRNLDCYTFLSITDFYICPPDVEQNPDNCTYTHTGIVTNYSCDFTDEPIGNYINTPVFVIVEDGGGSGYPNNGGSTNDDGNTNNDSTVITSPNAVQINHERSLRQLTNHTKIKARIAELRTKFNEDREYGYSFKLKFGNPIDYNVTPGILASDNKGINFEPPSYLTRLEMHSHYIGLASVFTNGDLFNTVRSATNANNEQHTSILVAPNGKLYALRINNLAMAKEFAKNYTDDNGNVVEEKFNEMQYYFDFYVEKKANKECAGACSDEAFDALLNKYLARLLDEFGTGLNLYEATEDANGTITWNQIIHN